MNIITKEELLQRYPSEALDRTSEDDFRIMAELALDVTEILCYGRASRKEEAARRAMMEIIAYWIEGGGRSSVSRPREPIKEAVTDLFTCDNPRCISSTEQELEHIFKCVDKEHGIYRCIYCEAKKKLQG